MNDQPRPEAHSLAAEDHQRDGVRFGAGTHQPEAVGFDGSGWPTFDDLAAQIAPASVPMLLEAHRWMHRRVETIEFLGESRIRRRVSLDFTLPNLPTIRACAAGIPKRAYVPLALLSNRLLERFDLRDEAGNALSLLGKVQHDVISSRILVGLARRAVRQRLGTELDRALADELDAMARSDGEPDFGPWEAAPTLRLHAQRSTIWNDPQAGPLMQDLSQGFVLFVALDARAGDRRVIKYSHEHELDTFAAREPAPGRWPRWKRALLLEPWRFRIDVPIGDQAASSHLELAAPDDLLIVRADLVRVNRQGPATPIDTASGTVAHLHFARQPREAVGRLDIEFVLRASGVLSAATLISLATTLMLAGGLALSLLWRVPVHADAAAVVVVVGPAIFAPFIAIAPSHQLVRRIVSTLRALLVAAAAISFAAAASLVADFPHHARRTIWATLFVLSLVLSVSLVGAWRGARRIERSTSAG